VVLPPSQLLDWPGSGNFVSQINAQLTWGLSQGGGVKVAVLDTGININHSAFAGRLLQGYNAFNLSGDVTDDHGHGTHVAGIIGAAYDGKGMAGVAPRASILSVKVGDAQNIFPFTVISRGMEYTLGRAHVLNMSFGANFLPPVGLESQFKRNVAGGQLLVAAAGNESLVNPGWPARYAKETWANGQIIAVGAVDSANNIASFSNRAGDTKNWYVVAPGVGINSTYIGSGTDPHGVLSGTSMAAPVVSGLAADVWAYWPHLKANQVSDIIFKSAKDLGTPGVDEVYGWGLVDAQKAMQPVGTVKIPVAQSKAAGTQKTVTTVASKTLDGSRLVASKAYAGALLQAARNGAFSMVALDEYGRDYAYDVGGAVTAPAPLSMESLFSSMDARLRYGQVDLQDGVRFAASYVDEWDASHNLAYSRMNSFAYLQRYSGGQEMAFGTANFASHFFGLGETPFNGLSFYGSDTLANPFMGLAEARMFAGYATPLTEGQGGWKLRYGFMAAGQMGASAVSEAGVFSKVDNSSLGLIEISQAGEGSQFTISSGYLKEDERFLGGEAQEAFAFGGEVGSFFTGVSAALELRPMLWAAGSFNLGFTPQQQNPESVIAAISDTASYSWSLGLVASDWLRRDDRIGVSLTQPLKVVSGAMTLMTATEVDDAGNVVFKSDKVSLKPEKTELDIELNYTTPMGTSGMFSAALMRKFNPGHDAGAEDETLLGFRYHLAW
jgi:hypothetical protein